MHVQTVTGNLLDQPVDVIVNAWNRNIIPWWLLRPHGVSGAIKRRAGREPFRELSRCGPLAPGQAVLTGPGKFEFQGIIHVAAITLWGRSNQDIIRASVRNAVRLARKADFNAVAFPILGSGSGGLPEDEALTVMLDELETVDFSGQVLVVRYKRS